MNLNEFKDLPPEIKEKLIQPQIQLLISAVQSRMAVLPTVSALSATLLVIATFSGLIPASNLVKILLTILLLMIPIPLLVYIKDLTDGENKAKKHIEKYLEIESNEVNPSLYDKFSAKLPFGSTLILTIVIFIIIGLLWCN